MFTRILVPLDGSSFGEAALPAAVVLARRSHGQLELLSVEEPEHLPNGADTETATREWRRVYLSRTARGRGALDEQVTARVRTGFAPAEILAEAYAWPADLIVMATHGRGGISRFWLGSVADYCMRHAHVPLLLVRPQPAETGPQVTFAPRRVVVALDGGWLAETALPGARALAKAFGSSVALLRVVQGGSPQEAQGYLDDVARRMRCQGETVDVVTITSHHIAQAILEEAGVDPVVMAPHGRSPAARTVLGSVFDKVARGVRGPVLVVPPLRTKGGSIEERILHCLDDESGRLEEEIVGSLTRQP